MEEAKSDPTALMSRVNNNAHENYERVPTYMIAVLIENPYRNHLNTARLAAVVFLKEPAHMAITRRAKAQMPKITMVPRAIGSENFDPLY
jgi:hypothetical protein